MARKRTMRPGDRRSIDNVEIRKLKKDGAYSVRVRTTVDGAWKYGKAIKISATTDAEAEAVARSIAAEAAAGDGAPARELVKAPAASRVADVTAEYRAYRAGRVALGRLDYRTAEWDDHVLKKIDATYGDVPYEALTPEKIEEGLAKLKAAGESDGQIFKVFRVFKQVSKYSRKQLGLKTSAFDDMDAPKKPAVSVDKRSQRHMEPEDVELIVRDITEAEKLDGNRVAIWLLLALGLRKGEVIALDWNSTPLYRSDGCTYIYRSVDGKNKTKRPKTLTSTRLVETDPLTIQLLETWRAMQQLMFDGHLSYMEGGEGPRHKGGTWVSDGTKPWTPDVPVCTNQAGSQLNVWTFDKYVKAFLNRLGIGELKDGKYTGPSIHSFRRFYGSNLLSEGTPLSAVRDMLGHKTSAVTADYYNESMYSTRRQASLTVAKTMAPDADYPDTLVLRAAEKLKP